MKTNFLFKVTALSIYACLTACTSYEDEIGFEAQLVGSTTAEVVAVNEETKTYDLQLKTIFNANMASERIISGGHIVQYQDYEGKITRNGNNIELTTIIKDCRPGTTYNYTPYLNGEGNIRSTFYSKNDSKSFIKSINEFQPIIQANSIDTIGMIDDHNLMVSVNYTCGYNATSTTVTMTIGNKVVTGTIDKNKCYALFDLNEITLTKNSYVNVSIENAFGHSERRYGLTEFYNNYTPAITYYTPSVYSSGLLNVEFRAYYFPGRYNKPISASVKMGSTNLTFSTKEGDTPSYSSDISKGTKYIAYVTSIDLYKLAVGSYPSITFNLANKVQSISQNVDLGITIASSASDPTDGDKGDYYQIGGVKWAKGEVYKNGDVYSIDQNEASYLPFGNTTAAYWLSNYYPFGETAFPKYSDCNVQNTNRDVVSAHLSGWKTPSRNDFEKLYSSSSKVKNRVGVYFLPSKSNKTFTLSSYTSVADESYWLKFRVDGYKSQTTIYSYYNSYYMTSEFYNSSSSNVYVADLAFVLSLTRYPFVNNFFIKPIKSY